MIIVTLSVVCTLKGMLRQSIQWIKATNAFNAMFVDTVDTYTGVCGSYTTPYAGVKTLHKVASDPCQEGRLLYCVSLLFWGFSCSPVSQSEEADWLTFLDLTTTRVIAGKTHSQSPILKTKGRSATQQFLQIYDKAASSIP